MDNINTLGKKEQVGEKGKRPFGVKDKIGYLFGDLGNDFTFQLASGYLLIFYTKVLGVGPGLVGTLFLLARFVDAFTDVGMGNILDRSKMKAGGRFRPWIKWMSLPVALASVLMYNYMVADWPYTLKVAYMFVTYILWGSVFYTSINIPYGSMASVMTQDATKRASLSTFRTMGALIAGVFIGVLTPLIIYVQTDNGTIVSGQRFFFLALAFGVFAFFAYQLCYGLTRERIEVTTEEKTKDNNILKDLKFLIKDKAFLAVIGSALLTLVASLSSQALNQYLFLDYFGNTQLLPVVGLIMIVGMLFLAPFAGKLTKRFGKKEASAVGLFITGGIYILAFFLKIQNPFAYIGLSVVAYIGMGYYALVGWAFLTDIIDNYQIQSGKRKDGTVYAVYSFSRKVGQAIAGGLGGWTLALIGYDSLATSQTEAVKMGIYNMAMLLPGISFLLTAVLLQFVYPLTKEKVLKNQKEIEKFMKAID